MALTKEQLAVVKENGIHLTPEDKEQIDSLTIDGELAPDALERIGGGFKISRNTTITLGIILLLGSVAAAGGWAYKNRNRGNQAIGKFPLAIKAAPSNQAAEASTTGARSGIGNLDQTRGLRQGTRVRADGTVETFWEQDGKKVEKPDGVSPAPGT